MKPSPFAQELAGLPAEVAAELEDHLMEAYDAGVRSGLSPGDARQAALLSLGKPLEIGGLCIEQSRTRTPSPNRLSAGQRAAVASWFFLAVGFAMGTCAAPDPSRASIGLCVGLSLGSMAMALSLRRGRAVVLRLGLVASLAMSLASASAFVLPSWRGWVYSGMGMSPEFLAVLALIGLAGGIALVRPEGRALRPA